MWVLLAISGSAAYVSYKVYHRFTGAYAQTQLRMITALITSPSSPLPSNRRATSDAAISKQRQYLERQLHLSTVAVGLTTAGAFCSPPVGVAGALVVVYLDWPVLEKALQTLLQEKRVRPPLLHSCARVLALWQGAYVLCAVDVLLYHWMQRRLLQAQQQAQQRLNSFFPALGPTVWRQKADVAVEVPTSAIQPNDTVIVMAGELAPVDGVITEGSALVDQPFVYDPKCAQLCEVGDPVVSASLIISGKVAVRAEQTAIQTEVARLAAAVTRAAQTPTPAARAGAILSNDLATPFLALGMLATLAFGPMSGATLLNAHFGEGIQSLAPLTVPHFLHLACQEQIWIKEGEVLEQLPQVDALVLAQESTHWSTEAIEALRARGIHFIYGVSPTPFPSPQNEADAIGLDAIFVNSDPAAQCRLLQELRRRHPYLGVVGDRTTDAALWPYAYLAIAFGPFSTPALATAAVHTDGDLQKLCRLVDLGRSFETNLTTSFGLTLIPGFVALAGAVLPGGGFGLSIIAEHLGLLAGLYNASHPVVIPTDGLYTLTRPAGDRQQPPPAPVATTGPAAPPLAALFVPRALTSTAP